VAPSACVSTTRRSASGPGLRWRHRPAPGPQRRDWGCQVVCV